MTKDKALKLALEALEGADWYINQLEMIVYSVDDDGTHENRLKVQQALTKIKEALAQPAQEPVAWMHPDGRLWTFGQGFDKSTFTIPLYTTPPKRKWIWLTEEDFQPMVQKAMAYYGYNPEHSTLTSGAGFYALVRNIEAKLKDKNNG